MREEASFGVDDVAGVPEGDQNIAEVQVIEHKVILNGLLENAGLQRFTELIITGGDG